MTVFRRAAPAAIFGIVLSVVFLHGAALAQSTNRSFPTPVLTNEISGSIRARDLGDARLTTHYYTFGGEQGDIFINVVTRNLDGDIDVFAADTLRPLTKIVVYSDSPDNETGRVIYLRQGQILILRVEGRTPNDDPATYRIKFAGSFVPSKEVAAADEPKVEGSNRRDDPEVKVNSVGTIVAVKPKPTPKPVEKETEVPAGTVAEAKKAPTTEPKPEPVIETAPAAAEKEPPRSEVVVTEVVPKSEDATAEKPASKPKTPAKPKPKKNAPRKAETIAKSENKEEKPPEPDPLASIRLIVVFKDGSKIERPMSEILRVSIDKGTLTIIDKNGSIGRYSILDVAKMSIE